ncbi:MAG TPA: TonB-dependent receptor [Woeseiaceae bacterium]|nr:TonB-dependent receptor [Woeseiaceae bacterium]
MNRPTGLSPLMAWPAAIGALVLAAGGARSQEPDAGPDRDLEQIVVTAQKREQTLMEIPQSITVVSAELLERQQANDFEDYLQLVPGLSLQSSTPGVSRISLRGVNTGGVASTVGVYVDEVPFGSSTGLANAAILAGDFDTFDVARLEVLRGPQGTLYGASSLGGVLRFVTNAPSTEAFEFRAQAGIEDVESGGLGWSARSLVNVPLSENFAVRASGFYRFDDGFIDSIGNNPIPSLTDPANNIVDGSQLIDDLNETDTFGGRVSGLFDTGAGFTAEVTAMFQNIESGGSDLFEADPETYEPLYGGMVRSQYHREPTDTEYRIYSAELNWDLDAGSLLSSTSFSTFEQDFQDDVALLVAGPGLNLAQVATLLYGDPATRPLSALQQQVTATDKFTQEIRFASPDGQAVEWLAGLYFTREESGIDPQQIFAAEAGTDTIAEGVPMLLGASLTSDYDEYAAFGNATWHVTDRFELGLGGRASRNEQSASQVLDQTGIGGGVINFDEANSSEDVFTWSFAPRFELADEHALYARIATGYRPGGPNVLPPGTPPGVPGSYDSDSLTSYEVGLKSDWPDAGVTLDVAAFWQDWEDIQLFAVIDNVGFNANGGAAVSKGLEFTATARPLEGVQVSLNGAWTDAYLEQDTDPVVGGLDGDPLPWIPDWSTTLAVDYEWMPFGDVTAWVGGDVSYTGERSSGFGEPGPADPIRFAPSYTTLDLRAGVDTGRWTVELYGRNLTDEPGILSLGGFGPGVPGDAAQVSIIRPLTIGLTVGVEF